MMIFTKFFVSKPSVVVLFTLCATVFVTFGGKARAEEVPLRVALIDTGENPSVPPALLDLLVVHLSQEKELAVLERQEIDAVFREQGRNFALADGASQNDLVTAGRILGADALVLLSAEPMNDQGLQPLKARIVETGRGVRCGETVLLWSEDAQAIAKQIESATEQITSRLGRVRNSKGKFTVVSLAGFRTDELSQEAHRFLRNLESWLESWLASQPGIAVAERTQVLPLIDERKFASDLPAALGAADATIDGTFTLGFIEQPPQVELTLRVMRKDRSVATHSLRAPIDEQANLRQSAGKAVLELLAIDSVATSFDAKAEARLLTDEAERLLKLGRRFEALRRLTAAYAIKPDSLRIQTLLLHAGERLGVGPDFSGATFDEPFYPMALLLGEVARRVLDQIEQECLPASEIEFYQRKSLLGRIGEFCSLMSQIQFVVKKPSEFQQIQHEWLRAAVSDLFARYLALVEVTGGHAYEAGIYRGLQSGRYWAKTPEEALAQRHALFQRAATLSHPKEFGVWAFTTDHRFQLTDNKAWAARGDLHQLYESYFRKMKESDHAVLQAVGEREAANFSLWILKDRARAMVHYRRFIQLIVEEIIPNHPRWADHVHGLWLDLNDRRGHLALTDEEAGELWSQVIRARWSPERRCPKASQSWEYRIKKTMSPLEKAGLIEQANDLLQTCIAALHASPLGLEPGKISSQWQKTLGRLEQAQQGLRERHPQLGGKQSDPIPTLSVKCQSLLHFKQMPELLQAKQLPVYSWRFSGLIATADGYAITCTAQEKVSSKRTNRFLHRERLSVVRLDKRGKIRSTSLFPESMEYDYRSSRMSGGVGGFHLPLATAEESVFVSVPSNGIVWFSPNKTPIHFSSKYLEQSGPNRRPVSFEEARQLTPIDGKLYFTSGKDPFHPRIYELDYQQGKSTVLLDVQSLTEESPLWARIGFSITAGPPGKLLVWALPDGVPRNGRVHRPRGGHLFTLNLQDKTVREVKPSYRIRHPWIFSAAQHHLGFQTQQGKIAVFNPETLSLDWLLADKTDVDKTGASRAISIPRLRQQECVYNERYLVTSVKKSGGRSAEWRIFTGGASKAKTTTAANWLLYEKGILNTRRLVAENLPSPEKAWRYLMNDKNQILMMTNKEVFRIELPSVEGQ